MFRRKYREHNSYVQTQADQKRLLTMNIKEGWKPLCEFLQCDVPKESFPFRNKVRFLLFLSFNYHEILRALENLVLFLTLIISTLSHIILCVGVTEVQKLMLKNGQGLWSKYF